MEENATKTSTQEKLEHQLATRHTRKELVERNIMKGESVSPALQSSFRHYQKAKMEDMLNRKLSNRPTKERLLQLGVLKDESLSPKLQQSKIELEKSKLENFLSKKLANRPSIEELHEKNVLKDEDPAAWRAHVEKSLEKFLASKSSNRFSSREIGEAIPMINWAEDAADDGTDETASSSIPSPKPEKKLTKAPRREPKTALKKHPALERELSVSSLQQKNQFIMNVIAEGRFICRNCCTEFFEGPEMASPRYSYNNFFDEEDWKDIGLLDPLHHPEGKLRSLCNMCFGVCPCGQSLPDDICDNCGTIKPMSQTQWRAPDYARPRTIEEWQEMRKNQLRHYQENYDGNFDGSRAINISFSDDVEYDVFERYRFRNTLTDEGMLMEECPEAPAGVLFSIEGDDDQIYEVETETEGFYFLKPDSAGNLFVIGVSEEDASAKNSTRVYLHDPAKNWFYYGDSSAGKIYCWDPTSDSVRPVG